MKIVRVKWLNHPILGNLELDFTNPSTGLPYDTVVFAGENGVGKTTILSTISKFLNRGPITYFDYIDYIVDGITYRAVPVPPANGIETFYDIHYPDGNIHGIRSDRSNNPADIASNRIDIRHHGCVHSKPRADFHTEQITQATARELDTDKYDEDKDENFTILKQLLVDLETRDALNYREECRQSPTGMIPLPDFLQRSSLFRFQSAFDSFFNGITYSRVADIQGRKVIQFNKGGRTVEIDALSTGEKQIVFRGMYLLKNVGQLVGAAIMIDEPELSMHPKWQSKVLKYYQDLFTINGQFVVQMFFASHSEHVLKTALEDRANKLVIVLDETGGNIRQKRITAPSVLPWISYAETNFLAFDIASTDYHIELFGWLQDKEAAPGRQLDVKQTDDFILRSPHYNAQVHHHPSRGLGNTTYETICAFVRNAIHHPDAARRYTDEQLRISILLLIELCRPAPQAVQVP